MVHMIKNLFGFTFIALVFVACGRSESPQMAGSSGGTKRNVNNSDVSGSGDAHSASFKCDKEKKDCPPVTFGFTLMSPGAPAVGVAANYRIQVAGREDPTRRFKFWLVNTAILGGTLPGPSENNVIELGTFSPNTSKTQLSFLVRDLDRCEIVSDPSSCQIKSATTTADSDGLYTINATGGTGGSSSDGSSASSGYSDADVLKYCDEKWEAEKKGDTGFSLPGVIGAVGSAISGDPVGAVTGILGGLFGGGDSDAGKPTTVGKCREYLGLPPG
ncbi:hypothetical protein N9W79_02335 [bacterium]|nr:hypothetical protein [bacterium]